VNYENGILGLSFGKGNHRAESLEYPITCCNADTTWKSAGRPKKVF
jgi:hypothetical protein